jgi:hypothetical protein
MRAFVCVALTCAGSALAEVPIDVLARELAHQRWQQTAVEPAPTPGVGAKLVKAREGLYSLLVPGWSQLRQGHRTRAALLAGAEATVWTSWIVSRIQGEKREDAYQDYAVRFAGVQNTDRPEEYWKAVAQYIDSDAYNDGVQATLRLGEEPEGGPYVGSDAWRWQSAARLDEYQRLRADSLGAFDRAETILLFAILTRAVAFADAVRSALQSEDAALRLEFAPSASWSDPGARIGLRHEF